jgi:hypothetical protein
VTILGVPLEPAVIGRGLVTAFFAIVFVQSALDKLFDSQGNIAFFTEHFRHSPFPPDAVPTLFWGITVIEALAGAVCTLGLLLRDFRDKGFGVSACGLLIGGIALLCLLLGQRMAKDYAGAAVLATYFAVLLIGLALF